eukprot:8755564-Prorocentrum_lima.AAC.1
MIIVYLFVVEMAIVKAEVERGGSPARQPVYTHEAQALLDFLDGAVAASAGSGSEPGAGAGA